MPASLTAAATGPNLLANGSFEKDLLDWKTWQATLVAHHLCIQLDAFKITLGGPVKMYVDWVKIYQR
ncbi:hypothetical protein [Archangium lipolyticum]|uniref:hypothetical protein n=1 Tax=Archangium lipolyticum TaxID=2970465 RepID=UPI00214A4475|nr:hypothetical protein [Archangium lipolyticum]